MLIIKAEYAHLIEPFVSTEQTRYYLNGFHVEHNVNGGVTIVATNGHIMGVFHDADGSLLGDSMIVKLDKATLKACKPVRKDVTTRWLIVPRDTAKAVEIVQAKCWDDARAYAHRKTDEKVPAISEAMAPNTVQIDGAFPDWRRVIPYMPDYSETPDETKPNAHKMPYGYNAKYLGIFGTVATMVRVLAKEPGDPGLVLTSRNDFVGVVMPVSGASIETMPAFMATIEQSKELDKAA